MYAQGLKQFQCTIQLNPDSQSFTMHGFVIQIHQASRSIQLQVLSILLAEPTDVALGVTV
jgi:hypothetical protein